MAGSSAPSTLEVGSGDEAGTSNREYSLNFDFGDFAVAKEESSAIARTSAAPSSAINKRKHLIYVDVATAIMFSPASGSNSRRTVPPKKKASLVDILDELENF